MLKLILGVTGIGLILLGVFGDKPLDDVYNRVAGHSSNPVAVEVPAVAESIVVNKDKTPVVEPTAGSVETMTGSAQVSEPQSQKPLVADPAVADPVAEVSSESDSGMVAVGEEVIATAVDQAPAITLSATSTQAASEQAATEQQLATARNDQVELAKTILSSTQQDQPLDAGVEVKIDEVSSLLAATAGQADNDILVVIKDKVNLREGPSIDHPVVLQLQNGQELMEFKREGKWVHVGAYGTSGKIGWVHQRLVGNSD